MADVSRDLQCALDTASAETTEDYTDWEIDQETEQRLQQLEAEDIHGDEGWNLRGDDD